MDNACGAPTYVADVVLKHYRNALMRQMHRVLGSTDLIEGSIGIVGNLGTGVYDLFYEPIEGFMDADGSFLSGLKSGTRSMGSKTIGGTAGQVLSPSMRDPPPDLLSMSNLT